MCGIAGLIHRGKSSNVGEELQSMLQALKHRGPDANGVFEKKRRHPFPFCHHYYTLNSRGFKIQIGEEI